MTKTLCLVQDIDESTAKGFSIDENALFAVKHDGQIYVYENSCPPYRHQPGVSGKPVS